MQQISALSIEAVLDEGVPAANTAYIELLLDALEDGEITDAEAAGLNDLRQAYSLSPANTSSIHEAVIVALDDGHVSNDERTELETLAQLLSVPPAKLRTVIDHADRARKERLGAGLRPLPTDWADGEPLRVGDRVAFTGCDEKQRNRLEQRAATLGVRVMNNVSKFTVVLVTDGSFDGSKQAKAREIGTRVVHPDKFDLLLNLDPPTFLGVRGSAVLSG
ncbi:BRCT domain-containing protein [Subtercola boreus]|uniref:BRCT domain-containing protein n=1 Tax=Subtercola boreus TaxID=120213 RepID=UPI00209C1FEB|nr:BRCT domain-containing protein [Subtercola boreus]